MRFVSPILTRRDLQHSGSWLALNWPMCRDRHPGILQSLSYVATQLAKLEGKLAWQAFQEVAQGWGGNEGIRIGQGIRFQPFSTDFGPWGGRFGTIFLFWGCPPGSPLFSLLYPYSPGVAVLCCVLIFVPLCRHSLALSRLQCSSSAHQSHRTVLPSLVL